MKLKHILTFITLAIFLTSCAEIEKASEDASSDAVTVTVSTEPTTETPPEPDATTDTTTDTPAETGEIAVVVTFEPYTPPDPPTPQPEPVTEPEPPEVATVEIVTAEITITPPDEETPIIDAITDTIAEIIDTPEPDPTPDTPPPPIKFTIKIDDTLYLNNGTETTEFITGPILQAAPKIYTHYADLITLDETGDELSRTTLAVTPTQIKITGSGDVYYCLEIPPGEAFEMGGQARTYTEIYKNNTIISAWYFNQHGCSEIKSVSKNVWIIDENGGPHPVESSPASPLQIIDNRFFMYDKNTIDKTIIISDGTTDSVNNYETNFALAGTQWILSDGVEYSESGTTWSPDTGLIESATALSEFNAWPYPITPAAPFGETPVFLAVGSAGGLLYWIETNSGWLFEYDPLSDGLTQIWRLYAGDGAHATGIEKRGSLSVFLNGTDLYYSKPGAVYLLDIETGFISIFYGGDGVVSAY